MTRLAHASLHNRILAYLTAHPWASTQAVAAHLARPVVAPLSAASISHHLLTLVREGRAQSRRQREGDVDVLGYALPESAALLSGVQLRRTQQLTRLTPYAHPEARA